MTEPDEGFNLGDLWPGGPPGRPDTPDFWRMVEIVQEYDIRMDSTPPEGKRREFVAAYEGLVDLSSLSYMAVQRGLRVLGAGTEEEVVQNAAALALMATLYMDAFLMGAQFERRGGHRG